MTQQRFEQENAGRWLETEALLRAAEAPPSKRPPDARLERLPGLFRELCADLALAQHRMYGERLCSRLNAMVIRARNVLSRSDGTRRGLLKGARALWGEFPRTVRSEWRLFWLNMLLFWGPFAGLIAAAYYDERWLFAILGGEKMRMVDGMYGKETPEEFLREEFGSNFMMYAYYVYNNISIGFRLIAGGVLATLGSVAITMYNGIFIGAIAGYVHYTGNLERFYTFVAGHSSFELLGLTVCGTAGMRLGLAVLKPGELPRSAALRAAAQRALPMIYGGPLLIFIAAFIEGFWSASSAPPPVKHATGVALWMLLTFYFLMAGRGRVQRDAT